MSTLCQGGQWTQCYSKMPLQFNLTTTKFLYWLLCIKISLCFLHGANLRYSEAIKKLSPLACHFRTQKILDWLYTKFSFGIPPLGWSRKCLFLRTRNS
jgi:hypothetical protein